MWVSVNSLGLLPVVELLENKHTASDISGSSATETPEHLVTLLALNLWKRKALKRGWPSQSVYDFDAETWGTCTITKLRQSVFIWSDNRGSIWIGLGLKPSPLGKLLNLFLPQFPHMQNRDGNHTYLIGYGEIKSVCVNCWWVPGL